MDTEKASEIRNTLLNHTERILLGPLTGNENEIIEVQPLNVFTTGILYPQVTEKERGTELVSEDIVVAVKDETDSADDGNVRTDTYCRSADAPEDSFDNDMSLTTFFCPSSVGLSIITGKRDKMNLECSFGRYVKSEGRKYRRLHYAFTGRLLIENGYFRTEGTFNTQENNSITDEGLVFGGAEVRLTVVLRDLPNESGETDPDKQIVTFSLINDKKVNFFREQKKESDCCIFQPVLKLSSTQETGCFFAFPDRTDYENIKGNFEELNNRMLYRKYKSYAQGHGISVNWEGADEEGKARTVYSEVIPKVKVTGTEVDFENVYVGEQREVLEMKKLSEWTGTELRERLKDFIFKYKKWIEEREREIESIVWENKYFSEQAKRNMEECRKLFIRMQKGTEALSCGRVLKAFRDANKAMYLQRAMGHFAGKRRSENRIYIHSSAEATDADCFGSFLRDASAQLVAAWRPFQLAFLLSQITAVIYPESDERNMVDLIWFPTGGGKTEAYLGLIAFTVFNRRLAAGESTGEPNNGAGVTAMMRYTLRMLNMDQSQRANLLICACDLIRRSEPENYGTIRISNGIWVGRSLTPNSRGENDKSLDEYIGNIESGRMTSTTYAPLLKSCPCCGNCLEKERIGKELKGDWGYVKRMDNRNQPQGSYHLVCTNPKCEFHVSPYESEDKFRDKEIPLYYVDEDIYETRPTLLFSTVDKYAQLAWSAKAFRLFNFNVGMEREYPGPELIVQDELHLINSALGTTYGIYEIAIDKLCSQGGYFPKIVGATATVRNAETQCKRLYARKHFMQFPPAGIEADDFFYSRKKTVQEDKNARLYVGFMPSGTTSATANIRLNSVLADCCNILPVPNEELDQYYTQLVYFNALKELGKFRTFLSDDIAAYRQFLAESFGYVYVPIDSGKQIELSSAMRGGDINRGLERLKNGKLPGTTDKNTELILAEMGIRAPEDIFGRNSGSKIFNKAFFRKIGLEYNEADYEANKTAFIRLKNKLYGEKSSEAVKIAMATNMIAVGIDIERLNVMTVIGQPKSASEYIQATSRVGRKYPGLIFDFLLPTKNRDRSHYENFKAFHQSFYKTVEPVSVTPYALPAMEKILPSVLVALLLAFKCNGENVSIDFRNDGEFLRFMEQLKEDLKARYVSPFEDSEDICKKINKNMDIVFDDFIDRCRKFQNERRFAVYTDFMEFRDGYFAAVLRNTQDIFDIAAQYAHERGLENHIPVQQSLRTVEANSIIKIK